MMKIKQLKQLLEATTSAIEREDWADAKIHAEENREILGEYNPYLNRWEKKNKRE